MTRPVAIALLGLALLGRADAACPDGDYVVVGEPLLASPGGAFPDVVTIADGTVAIASGCPAVGATFRTTRRGTVLRAVWPQCGSTLRVRLRAFVNKSCRTMRGRLVTRRPRSVRRFVAHQPPCEPGTEDCVVCQRNTDCAANQYCAKPGGLCGGAGTCEVRPRTCPLYVDPVCGCDGVTYGNRCEAAAHGVSVAHPGRCEPECAEVCDCYRTHTFPEPCPLLCPNCDNYWTCEAGKCVPHCGPLPEPPPVCEPRICGGIAGLPCPEGEFCDLPAGECNVADLQGVCTPVPKLCPDLYAPVCGCDARTYPNECERRMAGVPQAHDGPCGAPCTDACDCERAGELPSWCSALACPACGCTWACEAGRCAVEVVTPVPGPACDAAAR